ncbi:BTB/POZ domain-containing protein 16 [Bulinus truncatus]|nr:BTB/POZ domain-containing protein 16 [Bulinus truncatus]
MFKWQSIARPVSFDDVRRRNFLRPDVLLSALGINWELHRPYLNKSEVLSQLLLAARENEIFQNNCKNPTAQTQTDSSKVSYASLEQPSSNEFRLHLDLLDSITDRALPNQSIPITQICLDINDPLVTQRGLAVALSHLYRDDVKVEIQDVASVFAAAAILKFDQLLKSCSEIMMNSVNYKTVYQFHLVASQHNHEAVAMACESWLELNLIPKLSEHIELAELDSDLLDRILNSSRLFVLNELSVFKTLATWLFFKLNPQVQMMPSYTTVITYFNSLPKDCPFLENDDGVLYIPLFSSLRLHAIMDSNDIQDILLMNILPSRWVIDMLSQQHKSLHSGGDMMGLRAFHKAAIRQGIIVNGDTKSYTEILSLYGFYFELKVIKQDIETPGYVIYFQRLKPNDSAVSLKHHDRNTFSLRSEREVKYSITVQYILDSTQHIHSTGVHAMRFGVIEKTCRSQVLSVDTPSEIPLSITRFNIDIIYLNYKIIHIYFK